MSVAVQKFRVSGTTSYGATVDQIVTFTLEKSSSFAYGNGMAVCMETPNGGEQYFDVRYDTTLRRDGSNFFKWSKALAERYFDNNLKITPTK